MASKTAFQNLFTRGLLALALLLALPLSFSSSEAQEKPKPEDSQAEEKSVRPPLSVEWYRPEVGESQRKKWTRVILSGTTTPGARAYISSRYIPIILPNKKIKRLSTKKALASKRVSVADEKGYFEIRMDLPPYSAQLPIKVRPPKGVKGPIRQYQINMSIEQQEVKVTNLKDLKISPAFQNNYGVWLGSGFNYLRYAQASADIPSDLQFETFKGPSAFAKGWMKLSDQWDLILTAKMSPGSAGSSDAVQVAQGSYNWMIYGLEGSYFPESFRFKIFDMNSQLGWRFGIQHHIVPFIARTGNSQKEAEITTNSMSMLTGGFIYQIAKEETLSYEIFMRYQFPLSTGEVFAITPKFAFDGSLGAIYNHDKNWKLGVFWYGQWHEYSFTHKDKYKEAQGETPTIIGDQTLFFSNIELRLGYEFN